MLRHTFPLILIFSTGCLHGDNHAHDDGAPTITSIEAPTELDVDGSTAGISIHVAGLPEEQLSVAVEGHLGTFAPQSQVVITDRDGLATFVTTYTSSERDGTETVVANVTDFRGRATSQMFGFDVRPLSRYGEALKLPSSTSLSSSFLMGQSITVPARGTLRRVGIIAASPIDAQIGIYTDGSNEPHQLLAEISATLVAGTNEIAAPALELSAGAYWFMVSFPTTGRVFSSSAVMRPTHYISHTFGTDLPATVTTSMFSSSTLNYYLVLGRP